MTFTNVLLLIIAIELGLMVYWLKLTDSYEITETDYEEADREIDKLNSKLDRLLQYDDCMYDMMIETKNTTKDILNSKKKKTKKVEGDSTNV